MFCINMGGNARNRDLRTAEALRFARGGLRRHLTARVPHRIFPSSEGLMRSPFFYHSKRDLRPQPIPCDMKRCLSLIEIIGIACALLAWSAARIKSATPLPDHLAFCAVNFRQSTDQHVGVEDAPRFEAFI